LQIQKIPDRDKVTGTCIVCGGQLRIKGEFVSDLPMQLMPFGPASRDHYRWKTEGHVCQQCGIKYDFPPPKELLQKQKPGS